MFFHGSIVLLGFGQGTGRRLSSAGRTFRFILYFWIRKFGISFFFDWSILGPSTYIKYMLHFCFARKLCSREFPSGNSRTNISRRGLHGKKLWYIEKPRLRKVNSFAAVSHPIPTPSHHSPFVICFHRAMDRSLGRDSRRGNWSIRTLSAFAKPLG